MGGENLLYVSGSKWQGVDFAAWGVLLLPLLSCEIPLSRNLYIPSWKSACFSEFHSHHESYLCEKGFCAKHVSDAAVPVSAASYALLPSAGVGQVPAAVPAPLLIQELSSLSTSSLQFLEAPVRSQAGSGLDLRGSFQLHLTLQSLCPKRRRESGWQSAVGRLLMASPL